VGVAYRDTESLDEMSLAADLSLLSVGERARHARFVFAQDRRDFAAAHALLRRQLSMHAHVPPDAWTFDATPEGKPYLSDSLSGQGLAFNLSHTRGLVACAIGRDVDIGLDVESIDRTVDGRDIVARYFSPDEFRQLEDCNVADRPARFIELWTLKEAYIKAIGRGLSHPLDCFGFAFDGERGIRFIPPPDVPATPWTFALLAPSVRHRLAVAVHAPSAVVQTTDVTGEDTGAVPLRTSDW
jgi:4'-phosphopantetheinyl transferase